jgi:hypothetical protein
MAWINTGPSLVLFRLMTPHLQPGVLGAISGMGCVVPHPLATGGNLSYAEF